MVESEGTCFLRMAFMYFLLYNIYCFIICFKDISVVLVLLSTNVKEVIPFVVENYNSIVDCDSMINAK